MLDASASLDNPVNLDDSKILSRVSMPAPELPDERHCVNTMLVISVFPSQTWPTSRTPMSSPRLTTLLKTVPHTRYHAEWNLMTWHPRGVFDDALADEVVGVIQSEEDHGEAPFHRYTEFSGLTEIRLKIGHVFQIAEQRREAVEQVKSAFFAETTVGYGIARMYESLMDGAIIQVRAVRTRAAAAEWLGVPLDVLLPDVG